MTMRRCQIVSLCAVPLLVGLYPLASAHAGPKDEAGENARADDYFRQGKAFVKEDRWEEARRAYLAGYRIKRGYDIAGNLGSVELELGLARDAAEHLAYCIKSFPATGTAAQLAYIKGRFEEARQKVGALAIQVNVDGAEVFVDGRSIGRSPFNDDVYLEPGARTLEVKLSGYAPSKRSIEAARGAWQSVALVLRASSGGGARAAAPAPVPVPLRVEPRSRAPFFVGGSLALVGIGAGLTGLFLSQSSASRAEEQLTQLKSRGGDSACLDAGNRADCDALDRSYRDRSAFRTVSIAGFATGGAALGAILTYALLSSGKAHSTRGGGLHVEALAGPGLGGALVTGGF
jgi:hypothetical protein